MEDQKPVENEVEQKPVEIASPAEKVSKSSQKNKYIVLGVIGVVIIVALVGTFYFKGYFQLKSINSSIDKAYVTGDYDEIQKIADKGLEQFPEDKSLLIRKLDANSAYGNQTGTEQERLEASQPIIDNLLKRYSDDAHALLSVGYAQETAGKYAEALLAYEKALILEPEMALAHFRSGHVLAFMDRAEEAKAEYLKAYELDKNDPLVLIAIAYIKYQDNSIEEAIKLLKQVGENEKESRSLRAEAYTAAAYIEFGRGELDNSKRFISQATQMDPTFSQALGLHGYFLSFDSKTYKQGTDMIGQAIEFNPRIALNYFLLGLVMRAYDFLPQAVALQNQGLSKIETDNTLVGIQFIKDTRSIMNYELGITYAKIPDAEKSVDHLKIATAENPNLKVKLATDKQEGVFEKVQSHVKFIEL